MKRKCGGQIAAGVKNANFTASPTLDSFVIKKPATMDMSKRQTDKHNDCYLKRLITAANDSAGRDWVTRCLSDQFSQAYFIKLSDFVESEASRNEVYPPEQSIFEWIKHCAFDDIKVVILGQDPYHQPGQAHGLSFSVPVGRALPPSLRNIFKEVSRTIDGFLIPNHGCLISWATQGVLLLNACLTVRRSCANSHKDRGWEQFTNAVIKKISDLRSNVVFMLWGAYAKQKSSLIDKNRHCVLQAAHPSPFSANEGFFGCDHFARANHYLARHKVAPVNWNSLSEERRWSVDSDELIAVATIVDESCNPQESERCNRITSHESALANCLDANSPSSTPSLESEVPTQAEVEIVHLGPNEESTY